MNVFQYDANRPTLTEPYETKCACHGDSWLTNSFKLEHEVDFYQKLAIQKEKERVRLYNLINYYNGDPRLLVIRDRDVRRRHRWCVAKDRELEEKDAEIKAREAIVQQKEVELFQQQQRLQQQERRLTRQATEE